MRKELDWKARSIRMSDELWKMIKGLAKEQNTTKSKVVRDILREKLNYKEEE